MNKAELVAAIAEKTELSKKDSEKALKAFIDVVTEELKNKIQQAALQAAKALGLNTYCRVDVLTDAEENCYCLEANTLPGMTPTSLMPQAVGDTSAVRRELHKPKSKTRQTTPCSKPSGMR